MLSVEDFTVGAASQCDGNNQKLTSPNSADSGSTSNTNSHMNLNIDTNALGREHGHMLSLPAETLDSPSDDVILDLLGTTYSIAGGDGGSELDATSAGTGVNAGAGTSLDKGSGTDNGKGNAGGNQQVLEPSYGQVSSAASQQSQSQTTTTATSTAVTDMDVNLKMGGLNIDISERGVQRNNKKNSTPSTTSSDLFMDSNMESNNMNFEMNMNQSEEYSPGDYDKQNNSFHNEIMSPTKTWTSSNVSNPSSASKLKMNPRDAISPRRINRRVRSSISKSMKDYEETLMSNVTVNVNADSNDDVAALQLSQRRSSMSNNNSQAHVRDIDAISLESSSLHSSVGGLAYIETPVSVCASASAASISNPMSPVRSFHYSNIHASGIGMVGAGGNLQQNHQNPASVCSRSTVTSRESRCHTIMNSSSTSGRLKTSSVGLEGGQGPDREEQILFERRLTESTNGVAVRKIHSNGKSQLRHVKCIPFKGSEGKGKSKRRSGAIGSSTYSVSSLNRYVADSVGGGSASHNMSLSVPADTGSISKKNHFSSNRSMTSLIGRIGRSRRSNEHRRSHTQVNQTTQGNTGVARHSVSEEIPATGTTADDSTAFAIAQRKKTLALAWGNKKKVVIPLYKFTCVKKGKTTDRTKRNLCDPSKLLSIITTDERHGSLDIQAPTKLDRDKFAKAFSVFLDVPLEEDFVGSNVDVNLSNSSDVGLPCGEMDIHRNAQNHTYVHPGHNNGSHSMGDDMSSLPSMSTASSSVMTPIGLDYPGAGGSLLPSLTPSPFTSRDDYSDRETGVGSRGEESALRPARAGDDSKSVDSLKNLLPEIENKVKGESAKNEKGQDQRGLQTNQEPAPSDPPIHNKDSANEKEDHKDKAEDDDAQSALSSLTQGFDQEIVEELHQALNELRAELDASRAEAARAVKVAEQAIQSAESCSSTDWNSTVTHKAAEAAAQAQKRSAEAIAKQRLAEEKLLIERKSASFWRKRAQSVEDDAGALQSRLATAQVQRSAVTEELDREKRKAASYIQTMKRDYAMAEALQRETLTRAAEQNRLLEIELDGTRRDLEAKGEETKILQDAITDLKNDMNNVQKSGSKKKFFGKIPKKSRGPSLLENQTNSTMSSDSPARSNFADSLHTEELLKIQAESIAMKKQFEILRRTASDELRQLPEHAKDWAVQASRAVNSAQAEVGMLKNRLALEVSNRRKLLHEVQDLRGAFRVYCRPRPLFGVTGRGSGSSPLHSPRSIISAPSHDIGLLHREFVEDASGEKNMTPMCFEFDRMFTSNASQREVYAEMEELVLGSLEGYNACLMAYGQSGSGKTHTMIGDFAVHFENAFDFTPSIELSHCGIHLIAAQQLFDVATHRKDRFEDSFCLSILEIHDEKLVDLVTETDIAETIGVVKGVDGKDRRVKKKGIADGGSDSKSEDNWRKLEIRTNHDGDTVVQGLVSVPVQSYEEVIQVWKESLSLRVKRVKELGLDLKSYESSSHVVATIEVLSTNITTGIGTIAKLQCVDLAASDVVKKRTSGSKSKTTGMDNILAPVTAGSRSEWKFVNKSLSTLADVVDARVNFSRDTPYRNSTLTHVLRDALEADTKTMFLACINSDAENLQNTANSLRLASKIRKAVIGKATKRHVTIA